MARDVIRVDATEALSWIRQLSGPQMMEYKRSLLDAMEREALHVMPPLVPVDTGRLRSSIESRLFPDKRWVGTTASYGQYVARDTRPHIIMPKKWGGVLSWQPRGEGRMYARYVMHPGTTGTPYDMMTRDELVHKLPTIQRDVAMRTLGAV